MARYIAKRTRRARPRRRKSGTKLEMAVGRRCPYCGNVMKRKEHDGPPSIWRSPLAPTVDHVFPQSEGGSAKIACCITCNNAKGNMLPSEWLAYVIRTMPARADAVRQVFKSFNLRWDEPAAQQETCL